jgi:hypothetical protein
VTPWGFGLSRKSATSKFGAGARTPRHPSLRGILDLLADELDRPRPGPDVAVPALLDALLLHLLRAWFDKLTARHTTTGELGTSPGTYRAAQRRAFVRFCQYIDSSIRVLINDLLSKWHVRKTSGS